MILSDIYQGSITTQRVTGRRQSFELFISERVTIKP